MSPIGGTSNNADVAAVTGVNTGVQQNPPLGGFGVFGRADVPFGTGVVGVSSKSHGVHGKNGGDNPPAAPPTIGAGVWGESDNGFGVFGSSGNENGVHGNSINGDAVVGVANSPGKAGVLGISDNGNGVSGISKNGTGVFGSGGQRAGFFQGLLQVEGDITVSGDIKLTGGTDCAEHFDTVGEEQIEPGTVVVIGAEGALRESREAYDRKVAGVVSGAGVYRPAVVLGSQPSEKNRAPVALAGRVCCKADARREPIEIGDLLTTSPTPGHAMKATDPTKAFGAVIGKALGPLRDTQGLIPILVALQ